MKNVRSKKKLTLDSETIRHLRELALSQLIHARGGGVLYDESGGTCTQGQICVSVIDG
jgi:hypothetical protein